MGMSEYRLTVTVAKHGAREVAEDRMERLLDAFHETHPEVGAVVGANYHLDRLDVTFSLDAESAKEANDRGAEIFAEAYVKSDLEVTKIIEINCVEVGEASAEEADAKLVGAC
jgi:glycerol-3-phosphate dehydrogenase